MRRDNPDSNAKDVSSNLELDGWAVRSIGRANDNERGRPDKIAAQKKPRCGCNHLVEIKRPGGTLRQSQIDFIAGYPGCVHVGSSSFELGLLLRECEERKHAPHRSQITDDPPPPPRIHDSSKA